MEKTAFYKFKFGYFKIKYRNDIVIYLKKVSEIDCENQTSKLSDDVFLQIQEYLEGKRAVFDFPYVLMGTDFQKKVWNALCDIPYGQTRSYKDIAEAVGSPKAYRAVGMANNKNPITIALPCHRVIGANGKLVGYAGGMDMKEYLLELERSKKDVKEGVADK